MDAKTSKGDQIPAPSTTMDDSPPPYEEISRPPSSILTDITSTTITGPTQPISGRPFPLTFNLYYERGTPVSKSSKFLIGEHFDQPSNAAILSGDDLNIHAGSTFGSSIIATVHFEKGWSHEKTITLPGHFDSDGKPISQRIKVHAGFKHLDSAFTVPVHNSVSKPNLEKFEWRVSHGKEVEDLNQRSWGFKLVRLESSPPPNGSSSSSSSSEYGYTSDGKEVVAVWAANSQFSKNKLGKFQFMGSGAKGLLGEAWAIMAVATMLTMAVGVNKKLMISR